MLRVDLAAREIQASVTELAAWPPGPPRPGGWFLEARGREGIRRHRAWQEEEGRRDPSFRAEVPVSLLHRHAGFALRLHGRADGVRATPDGGLMVEEVKTTAAARPEHRRQLRLYVLCLAAAESPCAVRGRLVLFAPAEARPVRVEVPCVPSRIRRELDGLVTRIVSAARRDQLRRARRVGAADALRFPYGARRAGQDELEAAVAEGLGAGRPVLATAPTGTGKTVSTLLPALRHALREDHALYFLTAKTSQQELAARTFLDLDVPSLRACTLRAKAAMCPPGTLLCHVEHCALLARGRGRGRVEAAVAELVADRAHVAPDDVRPVAARHELCPYAVSLAVAADADLVIGDSNYAYAPGAALGRDERGAVVVVDEAHHLFDRARAHHSTFVARRAVDVARACAPAAAHGFLAELAVLLEATHEQARLEHPTGYEGHRPAAVEQETWGALTGAAAELAVVHLGAPAYAAPDHRLGSLVRDVLHLGDLLGADEPELVPYVRADGMGVLCVDSARRLHRVHRELRGVVAISATLSPPGPWAELLGLRPLDPVELALPSPFPAARRCVVVDSGVDTSHRARRRQYGAIARRIADLVATRRGNHAVYFPSHAFLAEVQARLHVPDVRLVAQTKGMTAGDVRRVLAELREASTPLVLLAVAGGTFAEGIDLPGEALVGAIVVGPCLPPVGFERACMRHHFDATAGEGFVRALLHPGLQRVVQAAGRVHRTPTDRGTIVLLGRRFATEPYLTHLPRSWYEEHPGELVVDDPPATLRAFWSRGDAATAARASSNPRSREP